MIEPAVLLVGALGEEAECVASAFASLRLIDPTVFRSDAE